MSELTFEFDEKRSAQRIRQLSSYYEQNVMEKAFICPSFGECKASISDGVSFYPGQLSHVGKRYDMKKNGKALRVVISGIEYGQPLSKVDMGHRYDMVVNQTGIKKEFYSNPEIGRPNRNPHMRGTTLLMKRIVLGEASIQPDRYANWEDEFILKPRIPKNHIFNTYAMVNFLLCSAIKDNTRGRSTSPMWRNCSTHYFETLKILEPNLLILQTKGRFEQVLDHLGLSKSWRRETETLGQFSGLGLDFLTCEFTHPSYPRHDRAWSNPSRPYFEGAVNPTLRQALEIMRME